MACSARPAAPTPDPFASIAQQASAAYDEGVQLFDQGRYAEAANDFDRARLLSPTGDPRGEGDAAAHQRDPHAARDAATANARADDRPLAVADAR